jgi:hypothetical protein
MKRMSVAQFMIRGAREALAHKRGKLRGAKVTRTKPASSFPALSAERPGRVDSTHGTQANP